MQADVARVLQEHIHLDQEAGKLQAIIASGPGNCDMAFTHLAAYANLLSEHLLGEHDVLQDAEQRIGANEARTTHMRSELSALRWDWEEYLSAWTADSARQDWSLFSEHSLIILDRIRRRISRENELLGAE